jgi:hypothetical protein
MRNVARDVAAVVDGVVLHEFSKGFVLLDLMGFLPGELDMSQKFDLICRAHGNNLYGYGG